MSLKSYDHGEFKSGAWKQIWQRILPCKILGQKEIIKIMCSTSLKRSGHVESKIGDLDEICHIILSCKI